MPYKINYISNTSTWSGENPTIEVKETDPNWNETYENWKQGKNPTDSKEWKKGVFATERKLTD